MWAEATAFKYREKTPRLHGVGGGGVGGAKNVLRQVQRGKMSNIALVKKKILMATCYYFDLSKVKINST